MWERGTRGQGGLLVWGGGAGICQRAMGRRESVATSSVPTDSPPTFTEHIEEEMTNITHDTGQSQASALGLLPAPRDHREVESSSRRILHLSRRSARRTRWEQSRESGGRHFHPVFATAARTKFPILLVVETRNARCRVEKSSIREIVHVPLNDPGRVLKIAPLWGNGRRGSDRS